MNQQQQVLGEINNLQKPGWNDYTGKQEQPFNPIGGFMQTIMPPIQNAEQGLHNMGVPQWLLPFYQSQQPKPQQQAQ